MGAIVGLGLLFDASSPLGARVVGLSAALVFGLGAWLLFREELSPHPSLRLAPFGLSLRLPPPQRGFDVRWSDLVAVRVVGADVNAGVVLDVIDPDAPIFAPAMLGPGGARPIESRALPRLRGVRAEKLAAEIERFRRAYRDVPAPLRREEMM